jgi:hypothetical protein
MDAATAAAVATVRPAARNELLAPERGDAIPALAGVEFDGRFVYEFHLRTNLERIEHEGFISIPPRGVHEGKASKDHDGKSKQQAQMERRGLR